MPRSIKKGPFIDSHLLKKVQNAGEDSRPSNPDLVASFNHHSRNGRNDFRGS